MTDICLFAHYDRHDRLADYVIHYLGALRRCGFAVTVISTARLGPGDRARIAALGGELILRDNVGHDFGSWTEGLRRLRDGSGRLQLEGRLLLANDSVYGPIGDLSAALSRLVSLPGDVHGMVESWAVTPHLQSWFLLFSPSAYRHSAFGEAFAGDFETMTKVDIIRAGEIGLSKLLRDAGLRLTALASNRPFGGSRRLVRSNPSHLLWRSLIEKDGVPFLKVGLLRDNPMHVADVAGWKEVVAAREPTLLPMIRDHLEAQAEMTGMALPRPTKFQVYAAFATRDDRFARQRSRIKLFINGAAWRVLLVLYRAKDRVMRCFCR